MFQRSHARTSPNYNHPLHDLRDLQILEEMSMTRRVLSVALLLVPGAQSLQLLAPSRRVAPVAPMVARFAPLSMQQDGARERENKKGRQATIARPKPKPKEKSKEEVDKEGEWKVLLHNDDVSLAATSSALLPACATARTAKALRPEPYATAR